MNCQDGLGILAVAERFARQVSSGDYDTSVWRWGAACLTAW